MAVDPEPLDDDFMPARERDVEAEAYAEMVLAQYDDDPNPYHGDYSEM